MEVEEGTTIRKGGSEGVRCAGATAEGRKMKREHD